LYEHSEYEIGRERGMRRERRRNNGRSFLSFSRFSLYALLSLSIAISLSLSLSRAHYLPYYCQTNQPLHSPVIERKRKSLVSIVKKEKRKNFGCGGLRRRRIISVAEKKAADSGHLTRVGGETRVGRDARRNARCEVEEPGTGIRWTKIFS
jgi:hypothetical protein